MRRIKNAFEVLKRHAFARLRLMQKDTNMALICGKDINTKQKTHYMFVRKTTNNTRQFGTDGKMTRSTKSVIWKRIDGRSGEILEPFCTNRHPLIQRRTYKEMNITIHSLRSVNKDLQALFFKTTRIQDAKKAFTSKYDQIAELYFHPKSWKATLGNQLDRSMQKCLERVRTNWTEYFAEKTVDILFFLDPKRRPHRQNASLGPIHDQLWPWPTPEYPGRRTGPPSSAGPDNPPPPDRQPSSAGPPKISRAFHNHPLQFRPHKNWPKSVKLWPKQVVAAQEMLLALFGRGQNGSRTIGTQQKREWKKKELQTARHRR